jgi:hypothetical protein
MLKEPWKILAATGLLVVAFLLFWMNRFQYERSGSTQVLVRINRFTGRGCFLLSNGVWDSNLSGSTAKSLDDLLFAPSDDTNKPDPYPGKIVKEDPVTGKPYLVDAPKPTVNQCK